MDDASGRWGRRTFRNVAELVGAIRVDGLLSQGELAERTGIAQTQLSRYEKGRQEPSLATLRRMLDAMGWSLVLSVEPANAEVDAVLDRPFGLTELMGWSAPKVFEVAALAHELGAGVVVGGEAAAVAQGVPVRTEDVWILVRAGDVSTVVRAASQLRHDVVERSRIDPSYEPPPLVDGDEIERLGDLAVRCGSVWGFVTKVDVLPASRLLRLDHGPWRSGRAVPVYDLPALVASGMLGRSAIALVRRMAERAGADLGAESIPGSVL